VNGIDPIKQVFAESTPGNHFLEITVGGTNQTDIYVDGFIGTDPRDLPALDCRQ
jgi:hypothetical protein